MAHPYPSEFQDVVDTIINMFGDVVSPDVVHAVVESYDGELEQSVEAVMNMTNESSFPHMPQVNHPEQGQTPQQPVFTPFTNQVISSNASNSQSAVLSYANISQQPCNNNAIVHTFNPIQRPKISYLWTDQIKRVVDHHNRGHRLLLVMRGVSGSGKSHLAKQIVTITIGATQKDFKTHIFSTDDYFMRSGVYRYAKFELEEAHKWNQQRVSIALQQGLSPIIVDNTNLQLWEFEPYVRKGVQFGYILEVVEPSTPWALKANQLYKRSTHDVPITTIQRMLDKYQTGITGQCVIRDLRLTYCSSMIPPVMRNLPPLPIPKDTLNFVNHRESSGFNDPIQQGTEISGQKNNTDVNQQQSVINDGTKESQNSGSAKVFKFNEMQQHLEHYEKVEKDWEACESWNDESHNTVQNFTSILNYEPKPERQFQKTISSSCSQTTTSNQDASEYLQRTYSDANDWRQLYPTTSNPTPGVSKQEVILTVEKNDASTHIESTDTRMDQSNKFKRITATPRDINHDYIPVDELKIPEVRMLDKSSMTADPILTDDNLQCPFAEQHFKSFKRHFKDVPTETLRDIFDKCCGDVNWAFNIIIDGRQNGTPPIICSENEASEDDNTEEPLQCNCFAKYGIIPSKSSKQEENRPQTCSNTPEAINEVAAVNKKAKKEKSLSESTIQLKRQIEHNVVFSDNHYSQHCLKIRKKRRGKSENAENSSLSETSTKDEQVLEEEKPGTSQNKNDFKQEQSDDESSSSSVEESEGTVNINIGAHCVSQLDQHYGREDMIYPANIEPKINVPVSILNEINALWMESVMHQLDEDSKPSAIMIQQDEEFARQLAKKEEEMALAGIEPEIPDFKEIMDLDLAISLYQKEVGEWRNNQPDNMAARMTRDKLNNLFPDISPDVLSELLMAHDNNFKATVESLLISTGKAEILEQKNGINKFVMTKELERQEKILKEQQEKSLSDIDWPFLSSGEPVQMSTVEFYRNKAEDHLNRRNIFFQKAHSFIHLGMTQIANYYSEVASYHKAMYERSNSLAASYLMQIHALRCSNNATIDLHYLRVLEAKESLDLFLDAHITKLKSSQNRSGPRTHTLFFITGRGRHSVGGPKIKPAIKKRLLERGLRFRERNPGLLTSNVTANDKLTHQIP